MANRDEAGVSRTPGWSAEVLRYLFEEAGCHRVGNERSYTDPGLAASAGDYGLDAYVMLVGAVCNPLTFCFCRA
ncbi:hypothetical protein OG905_27640 [Streptomyces sp. NBC_00322]|uniref:hypothetical protein n=1 Tax=Streptomyces sp. NBC_00322 TaxID=2975712 RepID=UPI002E288C74|nr:hypothetical protein [Streptomyces sp. NBC_00322]